jgi:hypothetical protein
MAANNVYQFANSIIGGITSGSYALSARGSAKYGESIAGGLERAGRTWFASTIQYSSYAKANTNLSRTGGSSFASTIQYASAPHFIPNLRMSGQPVNSVLGMLPDTLYFRNSVAATHNGQSVAGWSPLAANFYKLSTTKNAQEVSGNQSNSFLYAWANKFQNQSKRTSAYKDSNSIYYALGQKFLYFGRTYRPLVVQLGMLPFTLYFRNSVATTHNGQSVAGWNTALAVDFYRISTTKNAQEVGLKDLTNLSYYSLAGKYKFSGFRTSTDIAIEVPFTTSVLYFRNSVAASHDGQSSVDWKAGSTMSSFFRTTTTKNGQELLNSQPVNTYYAWSIKSQLRFKTSQPTQIGVTYFAWVGKTLYNQFRTSSTDTITVRFNSTYIIPRNSVWYNHNGQISLDFKAGSTISSFYLDSPGGGYTLYNAKGVGPGWGNPAFRVNYTRAYAAWAQAPVDKKTNAVSDYHTRYTDHLSRYTNGQLGMLTAQLYFRNSVAATHNGQSVAGWNTALAVDFYPRSITKNNQEVSGNQSNSFLYAWANKFQGGPTKTTSTNQVAVTYYGLVSKFLINFKTSSTDNISVRFNTVAINFRNSVSFTHDGQSSVDFKAGSTISSFYKISTTKNAQEVGLKDLTNLSYYDSVGKFLINFKTSSVDTLSNRFNTVAIYFRNSVSFTHDGQSSVDFKAGSTMSSFFRVTTTKNAQVLLNSQPVNTYYAWATKFQGGGFRTTSTNQIGVTYFAWVGKTLYNSFRTSTDIAIEVPFTTVAIAFRSSVSTHNGESPVDWKAGSTISSFYKISTTKNALEVAGGQAVNTYYAWANKFIVNGLRTISTNQAGTTYFAWANKFIVNGLRTNSITKWLPFSSVNQISKTTAHLSVTSFTFSISTLQVYPYDNYGDFSKSIIIGSMPVAVTPKGFYIDRKWNEPGVQQRYVWSANTAPANSGQTAPNLSHVFFAQIVNVSHLNCFSYRTVSRGIIPQFINVPFMAFNAKYGTFSRNIITYALDIEATITGTSANKYYQFWS